MRIILILAAAMSLARGACISVASFNILARDVAAAVPLFEQIDPETSIGFAPFPGIQRVLSSREMVAIAAHYDLSFPAGAPAPSVCVQRAVRTLSAEELRPVLLSALAIPNVQMEILEVSAQPVPSGRLEFRREGLSQPRNGDPLIPVIWRGRFNYDGQRSLAIWAKVRLTVSREVVVAAEEIPSGTVIGANQVQQIVRQQFPVPESSSNSLLAERIAGMLARRRLAAGERIVPASIEEAKDVRRGETVHVHVIDGGATITLDALAQSSGNKGETIVVHNPSSGKNFRALIEGPRQVVVNSTRGASL